MDGIECFKESVSKREQLKISIYEAMWQDGDRKTKDDEFGTLLDEYVRRYPDDPDGYFLRANFFMKTNRPKEAMAEYETVLRFNPNYALAYNSLGYYHLAVGELREGRGLPEAVPVPRPGPGEPLRLARRVLRHRRPVRRRRGVAQEGAPDQARLLPDPEAHLGTVAVGRGDVRAASEHFRRAAEAADSPQMRAQFEWLAALVLSTAGLRDEALAQFERIPAPKAPAGGDPEEAKRAESQYLFQQGDSPRAGGPGRRGREGPRRPRAARPPKAGEKEPGKKGVERDLACAPGADRRRPRAARAGGASSCATRYPTGS